MKRSLNNALALIAIVMGPTRNPWRRRECRRDSRANLSFNDMGELFPAVRAINKSGLSVGYTSLVTDFDVYIAAGRTATHEAVPTYGGSTLELDREISIWLLEQPTL
jgi:hypothetical protein